MANTSQENDEIEKYRDLIMEKMRQGQRREQEDLTVYSRKDLGIKALQRIFQARDNGVTGEDIQKAICKVGESTEFQTSQKEARSQLFIREFLSRGFYGYLKLRKGLGFPKETFKVRRWYGAFLSSYINLVNPGGLVSLIDGQFPTDVPITLNKPNVGLEGTGLATNIQATNANQKIVSVMASNTQVAKIGLTGTGTPILGSVGINVDPTVSIYDVILRNLDISNVYDGIVNGTAYGTMIHRCRATKILNDMVRIIGANDTYLDNVISSPGGFNSVGAGVHITATGGVWISDSDFLDHKYGLLADPVTSAIVQWLWMVNVAFDFAITSSFASADGMRISNENGGFVAGLHFTGGWASGFKDGYGIYLKGVDKTLIEGSTLQNNGKDGIYLDASTLSGEMSNTRLLGNQIEKWNYSNLTDSDGIRVAANTKYFIIIGNMLVNPVHPGANILGIHIMPGNSDNYVVTDNISPATIVDEGTGTHKLIFNTTTPNSIPVDIMPFLDASINLGSVSDRFNNVFGVNGLLNTLSIAGSTIINASRSLSNLANVLCDLSPAADNSGNVGDASHRWALIRGVVITPGDLIFENGWRFSEKGSGIVLKRPDGSVAQKWTKHQPHCGR